MKRREFINNTSALLALALFGKIRSDFKGRQNKKQEHENL